MTAGHTPEPDRYEIRIRGHLHPRWAAWFDPMTLTRHGDGTTVLDGPLSDQAALHGLLAKLRDAGLPLLSITTSARVNPGESATTQPEETSMNPATAAPSKARPARMDPPRRTALVAGTFYLITFLASIPAVFVFLPPVLTNPDYIIGAGADASVIWGCLLDIVNALACVGTAVALFPVVKRQNEALALGFVATRMLEAAVIMIGVVSLLAVVTLRQDLAGAADTDPATLVTTGRSLVAVRDWTFLLGPSLMASLNAVLLGTLMYRSRLVPRIIPAMGLLGAPVLLAATVATLFGYTDQFSAVASLAALPVALWELSLGIYLVVKGFTPSPITATTSPARA